MSALLPVEEAQARLFALKSPLDSEKLPLSEIFGRYLSEPLKASRDQPAAALSAMDGYAIRFADMPGPWKQVGESIAGTPPTGAVGSRQTMRIFTGAILPAGADTILIQEYVQQEGENIRLTGAGPSASGAHVRPQASDFARGDVLLAAGSRLTPGALALAAMSGAANLRVGRRPRVAIVATGDELAAPGVSLAPGQIPDSNGLMLAAQIASEPALLTPPILARDDRQILSNILRDLSRHHDVIVTIGGASVGDHDHVRGAITDAGGTIDFWRIAMRPGKPLLAATLGDSIILGLPGNPSSAFVTAILFLLPLIRHLAGSSNPLPTLHRAPLAAPLAAGGARRDYLRATTDSGLLHIFADQQSGLVRPLGRATALAIRETGAAAVKAGERVDYIAL